MIFFRSPNRDELNTLYKGFPANLSEDVSVVSNLLPLKTYNDIHVATEQFIEYSINSTIVQFPDRIYLIDVPNGFLDKLNETQKMILHCIYSRSCDGYVRQKHIKELLSIEYPDWVIPYIYKVCDEYVIEIIEMIYNTLKNQDTTRFKNFCLLNPKQFCTSYSRMISYWNEYYREKYYRFNNYVGNKLFNECFGYSRKFEKISAPNLTKPQP